MAYDPNDPYSDYGRRGHAPGHDNPGPWDTTPYDPWPEQPGNPTVPQHLPAPNIDPPAPTGGGGGGDAGPVHPPYGSSYKVPNAPAFHAPVFMAPTTDGMYADPGYQFRLAQGIGAINNSAAAKGLLRSGGTATQLGDYASNSASQEYSNIYGRALSAYDRLYQGAKDEYAPQYATWSAANGWGMDNAKLSLANMWADYFHNTIPASDMFNGPANLPK